MSTKKSLRIQKFCQIITLIGIRDAEKIVKRYENSGSTVIKAYAEPSELLKWCSANGETIDSKGRMAFANAKAYEYLVSKN
jgi:hypothetical protein